MQGVETPYIKIKNHRIRFLKTEASCRCEVSSVPCWWWKCISPLNIEMWSVISFHYQSAPSGWNILTVISNNCDFTSHFTEVFKIMELETSQNIMKLHFCFSTFSNLSTSPTFINISFTNLFGEKEKRAIRRQRKHLLLTFPFLLNFQFDITWKIFYNLERPTKLISFAVRKWENKTENL